MERGRNVTLKQILAAAAVAVLAALPFAGQAAPEPVTLAKIEHAAGALTVLGPDGTETVYSIDALEGLPTYSLRTKTPWRDAPATFEGVLLRDLLAAHGLSDAEGITVTAENDYRVTIPHQIWAELDVLIATRVDGAAHSRRARGPIQFVIDMDAYAAHGAVLEDHLVWMAARIEPAQ